MNILMLHNSYQFRGGEDESFESEVRMLRDAGHYVDTIHLNNDRVDEIGKFQVALQSIWSKPSYDLVDRKARERNFDVMHVQNFFPMISPSVYSAAKKNGVPVVQTLRNYRLLAQAPSFIGTATSAKTAFTRPLRFRESFMAVIATVFSAAPPSPR